jgi:hypothetical protein
MILATLIIVAVIVIVAIAATNQSTPRPAPADPTDDSQPGQPPAQRSRGPPPNRGPIGPTAGEPRHAGTSPTSPCPSNSRPAVRPKPLEVLDLTNQICQSQTKEPPPSVIAKTGDHKTRSSGDC